MTHEKLETNHIVKEMIINSDITQVYCLTGPSGEIGWFPPIDERIECIHSCDDIQESVNIDPNVIYICNGERCVFNCKHDNLEVNVDQGKGLNCVLKCRSLECHWHETN